MLGHDFDDDPDNVANRVEFVEILSHLRRRAGISIRDAARLAEIPPATTGNYFSGKSLPTARAMSGFVSLMRVLGVTDAATLARWCSAVERIRTRPGPRSADSPIPYLGLSAFDVDDAPWYYGREKLTGQVMDRLSTRAESGGFLFVIGPSGAGKSSLLRAGVGAAIDAGRFTATGRRWSSTILTPGSRPVESLLQALELNESGRAANNAYAAAVRRAEESDRGTVLVVDQFEELFGPDVSEADRDSFLQIVSRLIIDPSASATIAVVGMRGDFFQQAASEPSLVNSLADGSVIISPLSRSEVVKIITGPADKARLTIEPGLVDLLIKDLAPGSTSNQYEPALLPLIGHALRTTWENRERNSLTVRAYQETGGIYNSLAETAERVYDTLSQSDQSIARSLFLRLVHVGEQTNDMRRRVPQAEVDTEPQMQAVLQRFVRARLVVILDDAVELAHEALISAWPRFRQWLDDDRAGIVLHRRLGAAAQTWDAVGRETDQLYRGTQLAVAQEWLAQEGNRVQLNALESQFLSSSQHQRLTERRAQHRRDQTRRRLLTLAIVAALAFTGVLSYSITQTIASARARNLTQSRELAAQAYRFRSSDPNLAAQLSLAAYSIAPTEQARASVLDSTASPMATRMLGPVQVLQTVAVNARNNLLATAGTRGTIQLWNLDDRGHPRREPSPSTPRAATGTIFSLAFDPRNNGILASGGADRSVRLWNVRDHRGHAAIATAATAGNTVYTVAFSPNGRTLALGSADRTVRLVDVSDPRHPRPRNGPVIRCDGYVQAVTFSPDGNHLAAGCADGAVHVVDLREPSRSRTLTGPEQTVFALDYSADGSVLVAGSADKHAYLWETRRDGDSRGALIATSSGRVNAVAIARDGNTVAVGSSDNRVQIVDRASRRMTNNLRHPGPVTGVTFVDGGRRLATSAADGVARLWPIPGPHIGGRSDIVVGMSYAKQMATLAISPGETEGSVELWNTADELRPRRLGPDLTSPKSTINYVGSTAISPNGQLVAIGSAEGTVDLWDVRQPSQPKLVSPGMRIGTGLVQTLAFNATGTMLAAGGDDQITGLWNVTSPSHPRSLGLLSGPGNSVYAVAFSADSNLLAVGSLDNKVWLWKLRPTPQRLAPLTGFEGYVQSVAFSPTRPILAAGSADRTVRMWDLSNPKRPIRTSPPLIGATNYVYSVAFSPDGTTLAAGGSDRSIWMWDVRNPATPRWRATLAAADDSIFSISFNGSGTTLAAATADRAVQLWNTDPRQATRSICAMAGDGLTRQEWARYVPGRSYAPPCP